MSDLYTVACQRLAEGRFDWRTDPLFFALVDDSYVPDFAADSLLSQIPPASILMAPVAATNPPPTVVDGWCYHPFTYSTQYGPAPAIKAVLVLHGVPGVIPHATPPYDQLGLVAYIDEGYHFGTPVARQQALYIIWPGPGVFRP